MFLSSLEDEVINILYKQDIFGSYFRIKAVNELVQTFSSSPLESKALVMEKRGWYFLSSTTHEW